MASKPVKRPRLTIDVPPEIRRRVKAQAAMEEMTVNEWILGLIMDELAEDADVNIALERLGSLEDNVTLKELHRQRQELERQGEL